MNTPEETAKYKEKSPQKKCMDEVFSHGMHGKNHEVSASV